MPRAAIVRYSSGVRAIPPPRPPSVNAGRMIAGSPSSGSASTAWSTVVAITLSGMRSPARSMACRNRSRSSAQLIAS